MQEKTIKSVLRKKLDDWLVHVDDANLRDLIRRDALCTGGAIASMLLGETPNDFDFYFRTKETCVAVARYYVERFKNNPPSRYKNATDKLVGISVLVEDERVKIVVKSQGIAGESGTDSYQYFEQVGDPSEPVEFVEKVVGDKENADKKQEDGKDLPRYRPVFLSSNAISLSDKIQLVVRFWGPVDTIHENYDFVHCTCSWDAATNELILPPAALISLLNKRLRYKQSKYPLCSLIRTRKFLKAGWQIDAGQYVKMAWDLNRLDLSDVNVLEDQMVGVDSAYFHEVIAMLRDKTEAGKPIDQSYLIQIIDRVFG